MSGRCRFLLLVFPVAVATFGLAALLQFTSALSLAANTQEISIVDVGGFGGDLYSIAVSGCVAYAGQGGTFSAFDISDPGQIRRISYIFETGMAREIRLVGTYVVIAASSAGLQIVDVSDPLDMQLLGVYTTTGMVWSVDVEGSFAYIIVSTGYTTTLQVIDIQDPREPVLVGSISPAQSYNQLIEIDVVDGFAYVIGSDGLRIYDVSDPTSPKFSAHFEWRFYYNDDLDIKVVDQMVILVGSPEDDFSPFVVIDVSIPTNPIFVSSFTRYDQYHNAVFYKTIDVQGAFAYVGSIRGIDMIDLTDPAAPSLLGTYALDLFTYYNRYIDLDVQATRAYLVGVGKGFRIIDVSSPQTPILIGEYGFQFWPFDVQARNSILYSIGNKQTLVIYNASDLDSPELPMLSNIPGYGRDFIVLSDTAYVNRYNSAIDIYDVTQPMSPTLLSTYDGSQGLFTALTVSDDYAYIGELGVGINVLDVSSPTSPTYLSTVSQISSSGPIAMKAKDDRLYVAAGNGGLVIVDIADSFHPQVLGRDSSVWASAIDVIGGLAYVGASQEGLYIFDVITPTTPVLVGQYSIPSLYPSEILVLDNLLYMADSTYGLWVFDVSNPHSPTLFGQHKIPGFIRGMDIEDGLIYLACSAGGLRIVRLSDSNPDLSSPLFLPLITNFD